MTREIVDHQHVPRLEHRQEHLLYKGFEGAGVHRAVDHHRTMHAGERFEAAANKSAGRLDAVLEPVMILIIGAFVGMIAYAALMPIIKIGSVW